MLRNAFPDLHYAIEVLIAEGDLVAGYLTAHVTQTGECMGVRATGKRVTWTETHIGRYSDGKLVAPWVNSDQLGMMHQLGATPGA
jgi:predicted ester cyclase